MSLKNQSIGILKLKCELLKRIIEENLDDPRVGEPKRQLRIIEEELESRENEHVNEDEEPKGLVVGLKTLELASSSHLKR